ncbi:MAG: iron uptake transporter deferrochelatase/peroxidase subunit [Acidiphilium sp.]|nr:iron uptake transporter deferrochelatase/peroxidase subunit [Acidiphilium sp.]MDD4935970.1 iron uptake transporter deferrochelatase/peroxidase subunit [Acidiphilium sp.]
MSRKSHGSRRTFIAAAGGIAGALGAGAGAGGGIAFAGAKSHAALDMHTAQDTVAEPFFGSHQNGIAAPSPMQSHTYFAALDITATDRKALIAMLQTWTAASARLTAGRLAMAPATPDQPFDSLDALDLGPSRLTLTFGFGPDLFTLAGKDRFGLAARRPAALVDLPAFPGEQLEARHTGGAVSVQACADDPQVAFHAVRELVRLAGGNATVRWTQAGFSTANRTQGTARNLMGFKDGTMNPPVGDAAVMNQHIWVGSEGPRWMQGGSYAVFRRIRIALEHWDQMKLGFQERTIGRHKLSGAPLGGTHEFDALDLKAQDKDGNPIIPATAHARLGAPSENAGAQMLRRAYNYTDGASFVAERWPPWKQAMEYDAGLMFIAYQHDPRRGFIPMFEKMSRIDALNQFTTHVGSAVFACPGGVRHGQYIGQGLFEAV